MAQPSRKRLKQPIDWEFDEVEEARTKCKHGWFDCGTCGTSQARDALHTTIGGKGEIARLREKERRR
jgi:hypothetical protein